MEETKERHESEEKRRAALDLIERFKKSELNRRLDKLSENLKLRLHEKKLRIKDEEGPEALEEFEKSCNEFEAAWEAAWILNRAGLSHTAMSDAAMSDANSLSAMVRS